MRERIAADIIVCMPQSPSASGATLYELELVGAVLGGSPSTATTRRSMYRVTALWPEAAAVAGQQLFIDEAGRRGMLVEPGLRVCSCTPLER